MQKQLRVGKCEWKLETSEESSAIGHSFQKFPSLNFSVGKPGLHMFMVHIVFIWVLEI